MSRQKRKCKSMFSKVTDSADQECSSPVAQATCTKDTDFEVPSQKGIVQEAPVFHPTAAEWSRPMEYIKHLQSVAGYAGICRIVPPDGWQPPFAAEKRGFRFKTRVQNVSMVDGCSRIEKYFVQKLRMYHFMRGTAIDLDRLPVFLDVVTAKARVLDLYHVYRMVQERGGFDQVCESRAWGEITKELNLIPDDMYRDYKTNALPKGSVSSQKAQIVSSITPKSAQQLALLYCNVLLDFVSPKEPGSNLNGSTRNQNNSTKPLDNTNNIVPSRKSSIASPKPKETKQRDNNKLQAKTTPHRSTRIRKATFAKSVSSESEAKKAKRGPTPLPVPHVGAEFVQYFPEFKCCFRGTVVGKDVTNNSNKVTWKVLYSESQGSSVSASAAFRRGTNRVRMDDATLQLYMSSGGSELEATEAFCAGICQVCLRAHNLHEMLLCDSCNFGFHIDCLDPPLRKVPSGDWYCQSCIKSEKNSEVKGLNIVGADKVLSPAALPEIAVFGFGESNWYTMETFRRTANEFEKLHLKDLNESFEASNETTPRDIQIEKLYWEHLSDSGEKAITTYGPSELKVLYGSDLDTGSLGSGFPTTRSVRRLKSNIEQISKDLSVALKMRPQVKQTCVQLRKEKKELEKLLGEHEKYVSDGWNLNNLPTLTGSLLQHVDGDITGIMVPWLYMGMAFSSFCWHTEDHYFASINFVHFGAPKAWYGVPGSGADSFERAAKEMAPELFEVRPDVLSNIVTMFNPSQLSKRGVPVYRTTQMPGQFVVTFPRAYHGGFNMGFNCAEAVNFATPEWLPFGAACLDRYCSMYKVPIIAHEALVLKLAALCATGQETVEVAQHLLGHIDGILRKEKRHRLSLQDSTYALVSEPLEEFENANVVNASSDSKTYGLTSNSQEDDQVETVRYDSSKLVRKTTSRDTTNLFGRDRSKNGTREPPTSSRMQRMQRMGCLADDNSSNETASGHLQRCSICQMYCPLSFVYTQGVPNSPGVVHDRIVFCVDHTNEAVLDSTKPDRFDQVRLVQVHTMQDLEHLRSRVGIRAVAKARWEERLRRLLVGVPQPDDALGQPRGCESLFIDGDYDSSGWSENGSEDDGAGSDSDVSNEDHCVTRDDKDLNDDGTATTPWPNELVTPTQKYVSRLMNKQEQHQYVFNPKQGIKPDMAQMKRLLNLASKVPIKEKYLTQLRRELDQANFLINELQSALPRSYATRRATTVKSGKRNQKQEKSVDNEYPHLQHIDGLISLLDRVRNHSLSIHRVAVRPIAKLVAQTKHWQKNEGTTLISQIYQQLEIPSSFQVPDGSIKQIRGSISTTNISTLTDCLQQSEAACKFVETKLQVVTPEFVHLSCLRNCVTWVLKAVHLIGRAAGSSNTEDTDADANLSVEQVGELIEEATRAGVHENQPQYVYLASMLEQCQSWKAKAENIVKNKQPNGKGTEYFTTLGVLKAERDQLPCYCEMKVLDNKIAQYEQFVARVTQAFNNIDSEKKSTSTICRLLDEVIQNSVPLNDKPLDKFVEHLEQIVTWKSQVSKAFGVAGFPKSSLSDPNTLRQALRDQEAMKILGKQHQVSCIAMQTATTLVRKKETAFPPLNDDLFCVCRKPETGSELMIQCDECMDWYHPKCIELQDDLDAIVEETHFKCPACLDINNSEAVFCVCRKRYADGVKMFQCNECVEWYHPQCLGISEKRVQFLEANKWLPFTCPTCCHKLDIPIVHASGATGFVETMKMLLNLRKHMISTKSSTERKVTSDTPTRKKKGTAVNSTKQNKKPNQTSIKPRPVSKADKSSVNSTEMLKRTNKTKNGSATGSRKSKKESIQVSSNQSTQLDGVELIPPLLSGANRVSFETAIRLFCTSPVPPSDMKQLRENIAALRYLYSLLERACGDDLADPQTWVADDGYSITHSCEDILKVLPTCTSLSLWQWLLAECCNVVACCTKCRLAVESELVFRFVRCMSQGVVAEGLSNKVQQTNEQARAKYTLSILRTLFKPSPLQSVADIDRFVGKIVPEDQLSRYRSVDEVSQFSFVRQWLFSHCHKIEWEKRATRLIRAAKKTSTVSEEQCSLLKQLVSEAADSETLSDHPLLEQLEDLIKQCKE